jgi:hypothetical protein
MHVRFVDLFYTSIDMSHIETNSDEGGYASLFSGALHKYRDAD